MRFAHASALTLIVISVPGGAKEPVRRQSGYVVVRSDPELIQSIGIGPGVCFAADCSPGVILRRDGSGAMLLNTDAGLQETAAFSFDPAAFGALAEYAARIRHRGLPCKMLMTDGGGASVFWSMGRQRVEISFVNGCRNKDEEAVVALYDKIIELPEVESALQADISR